MWQNFGICPIFSWSVPLMQATFAMVRRLPPPATGAHILTWLNSTGTWPTTYAWVSAVMQLIIRHTVHLYIIPHLLFRPRDEGIHLDELVHLVPLYNLHILTGNALFTTQATYPYIKTLKGTLEGFELTNLAATKQRHLLTI